MCRILLIGLGLLLVTACASVPEASLQEKNFLHDDAFDGFEQIKVETEQQVFSLDRSVTDYLEDNILTLTTPLERMDQLSEQLFNPEKINLLYQTNANGVASQTFNSKTANCLSMSILAYSMAKYVGLSVTFQDVVIPEFWNLREDVSFLNGHVNLVLFAKTPVNDGQAYKIDTLEVDFSDSFASSRFRKNPIGKKTALAMFYNNIGAEALVAKDFNRAYAYFRQAMLTDPDYISGWSNLGVLYRMSGHYQWAEQVYNAGLALDDNNRNILDNLVVLLEHTDRKEQADEIRWRINKQRQSNPYYHYFLGQQEYQNGNWQKAIQHFRRAKTLNQFDHHFYFGLAKAYFELGNVDETRRNLNLARRYAIDEQQSNQYLTKLSLLH
ncbi:tetratricopeptide repeat protein [Neptunicella sp. SCSIO 80796]|uniref:tetratricopeptide repeat protein n=1 Tax=Neptunicella plasticusilytica TaxID=3117012 RepID=UPI003A4D40D1